MIESIIPSWGHYSRLDIEVLYAPKWAQPFQPEIAPVQRLGGYKGPSYMDSGYFYAPYLPLVQTPVVLERTFLLK